MDLSLFTCMTRVSASGKDVRLAKRARLSDIPDCEEDAALTLAGPASFAPEMTRGISVQPIALSHVASGP